MEYRKFRNLAGMIVGLAFIIFSAFLFSNWITLNFHQVIAAKVYRSRQLNYPELSYLNSRYHFGSIINLRGIHPQASWFQAENRLVREQHLQHYTFTLPAHALPTWPQLTKLVNIIEQAPKPVLLHCREGADRTGLASAISLILAGSSKSKVKQALTWRKNVISPQTIGYQVMQNYFAWFQGQNLAFGRASFLAWVKARPKLVPQFGWYY